MMADIMMRKGKFKAMRGEKNPFDSPVISINNADILLLRVFLKEILIEEKVLI